MHCDAKRRNAISESSERFLGPAGAAAAGGPAGAFAALPLPCRHVSASNTVTIRSQRSATQSIRRRRATNTPAMTMQAPKNDPTEIPAVVPALPEDVDGGIVVKCVPGWPSPATPSKRSNTDSLKESIFPIRIRVCLERRKSMVMKGTRDKNDLKRKILISPKT